MQASDLGPPGGEGWVAPEADTRLLLTRARLCRIADTQLTQQELPACKPVLDATWVSGARPSTPRMLACVSPLMPPWWCGHAQLAWQHASAASSQASYWLGACAAAKPCWYQRAARTAARPGARRRHAAPSGPSRRCSLAPQIQTWRAPAPALPREPTAPSPGAVHLPGRGGGDHPYRHCLPGVWPQGGGAWRWRVLGLRAAAQRGRSRAGTETAGASQEGGFFDACCTAMTLTPPFSALDSFLHPAGGGLPAL